MKRRMTLAVGILGALVAAAPVFAHPGGGGHSGGGGHAGGGRAGGGGHAAAPHYSGGAHFGGAGAHYAAPAHAYGGYAGHAGGYARAGTYARAGGYGGAYAAHGAYGGYHGGYAGGGYRGYGGYGGYRGGWGYHGFSSGARWGGGWWHGGWWPRAFYGPGFAWFLPVLPLAYATYWYGGVPYYYADDAYYTWDPGYNGYVATDPPPIADPNGSAVPPGAPPQAAPGPNAYPPPGAGPQAAPRILWAASGGFAAGRTRRTAPLPRCLSQRRYRNQGRLLIRARTYPLPNATPAPTANPVSMGLQAQLTCIRERAKCRSGLRRSPGLPAVGGTTGGGQRRERLGLSAGHGGLRRGTRLRGRLNQMGAQAQPARRRARASFASNRRWRWGRFPSRSAGRPN